MLEMGARFTNVLYIKVSFDPDNGDCGVTVETVDNDGEPITITGTVTWDE